MTKSKLGAVALNMRRLRERLGWSQERLATEAKTSQTTIDKIERGLTKRTRYLSQIASALGVTVEALEADPSLEKALRWSVERREWIEDAQAWDPDRLPVFSTFEGRTGTMTVSNAPISHIGRPSFIRESKSAYAIVITGRSMAPEFEPGDIAFIDPEAEPADTSCLFYNSLTRDANAMLARLVGFSDEIWLTRQWHPLTERQLVRSEWHECHRVLGRYIRR
ncbi:helix-turn-helix domain-containing protein [Enterovirga sp. CN4-39]|uniref:helix-turn-helix domain-containing protein n=1 Tax=Enterovirga sp. CN4-39 TaxID=3400910 RepID=UPI003BFE506A